MHCPLTMIRLALASACCLMAAGQVAAQDMPLSEVLIDGEPWREAAAGHQFTEGPAVDHRGNLYFTDVRGERMHLLDVATGQARVFVERSARTNGLMFGPDGKLYGCRNGDQQIAAYDAAGRHAVVVDGVESNDLAIAADGGIYFTDPRNHRVWYVSPKREKRMVDEGIERPNGIILWPGGGTVVVADSAGKHLWTFRVEPDGSLGCKQPYYTLRTPTGETASRADGMTVDRDGRLYVASAVGLQVFDPTGRLSGVVLKPHHGPLSNVVFAGPELDTLFVTAGDKVFCRRTKVRGLPCLAAN